MRATIKRYQRAFSKVQLSRSSKIFLAGCIAFLTLNSAANQQQEKFALNAKCEPEGFISSLRESQHPHEFWVGQLSLINEEMKSIEDRPRIMAENEREANLASQKNNSDIEQLYSKYPEMRSPEEALADNLRMAADKVELQGIKKMLLKADADRWHLLNYCRAITIQKTKEPDYKRGFLP